MSKLIDVAIKVPEEYIKNGQLELVTRQIHQRIKAMTKIPILNEKGSQEQAASKVIQAVSRMANKTLASEADIISSGLKDFQRTAKEVSDLLTKASQQMAKNSASIEKLLKKAGKSAGLGYLGIGLQLANIAIDAVGFVVIAGKIQAIDEKVGALTAKLDQIHYMMTAEKIAQFQKLVMRFSAMTTKITDHDALPRDTLEALLIDIRAFISEMVHNFNYGAMDASLILEIIFDLLSAYSALLCVFLREYYFEKHRKPDNFAMFIGVYQDLMSNEFLSSVRNYLFLERRMTSRETMDAINAQNILTLTSLIQVNDQVDLLELTKTRERYLDLIRGISDSAEAHIRAHVSEIAKESGVSSNQCENILSQMFEACAQTS